MAIQLRRGEYSNFDPTKLLAGEVAVVQGGDSATSSGKTAYLSFGSGTVKRLVTEEELGQVADDLDDHITDFEGDVAALEQTLGNISSTATAALTKANDNENAIAETNTAIAQLRTELNNVSINPDDLGLYQDSDTGYVYPTYKDVVSENGIPLASGGGGGGGGSTTNAVLTVTNTTGWLSKTISTGASCPISIQWSSIEDELPTGNGAIRITVNDVVKANYEIPQGTVNVDLAQYILQGNNKVKVRVSDVYDQGKTITFTITSIALKIESTFDTSQPFTGTITFPFTPSGDIQKTVHFVLDGVQLPTMSTSASGRQVSYTIPAQTHGAHSLRVYFEVEINNETVSSNELYYEFIFIEPMNNSIIIVSSFNKTSVNQYESVVIPYRVYDPRSDSAEVNLYINNTIVSTQTVDRTEQSYTIRANNVGALSFKIESGTQTKTITMTVIETEIDVEAETENLALYLNAQGRSNNEADWNTWEYEDISATFTNFNKKLDGWQKDDDGIDVLRLVDNARVTIPYQIFGSDFKNTGKTIEIEFASHDVADYTANIITCFADNIGLKITPQNVMFKGAQTSTDTLYKDNEHVRLSIVVSKQASYRLILIYINGIMSRAIQYASGERFSQTNPVGISIGSNDCGVDIYCIRVYDNDLNREQILDNWIADTQVGTTMLERYTHNNVYDAYGKITVANLPNDLPYFIIEAPELPQYKGDKKTVTGSYNDPVSPSKSFTFEGCEINVQGTSSAPYFRKNYDMKFKQGFISSTGTSSTYALRTGSIPFNRFVIKADVASSESANNTKLTMFYNDTCPYKVPEMLTDSRVRWGIEGIPTVLFWYNPTTQTTEFMGKYNFNLPKRCPDPLGYSGNMESWEWERNNSANVKFQDNDFTSQSWDETKQQYYPTWYDDFEARFPSDEWRDYAKLNEMLAWVKSTWRDQATNESLPEDVTYRLNTTATISAYSSDTSFTVVDEMDGGVATGYKLITFTKDTPAYRLTKFRAEFGDRFEIESATFYYLFTLMFLMIDSRAKNMFIGFHGSPVTLEGSVIDRKAVFEPYDMDTAIGTNNSGVLMFGYYLEDTDTVSSIISGGDSGGSNAPVYNAQDSVLWSNFRDAFRAEYTQMYRTLRAGGAWSYQTIEQMYEDHQSKWCEAIFNEDAYTKYLVPLLEPVTYDEDTKQYIKTDRYLTMLQGSKKEQRKWWLYNRFRYLDSKFSSGDAYNKIISMRVFNSGTLTLTSAVDMYAAVSFGGGTTIALQRTTTNTPVSFTYTAETGVTEMETWIYSGDLLKSVGDLSVFYPNELDFSKATRLKTLKIGDSSSSYRNDNLTTLDVQNSILLESIDCRNCPNLAITVNLENSSRLREAYFDGTSITGVELADGCVIETLHLPSTIAALTLLNLSNLEEFVCPSFANVQRLMLDSIDQTIINPVTILNQISEGTLINLKGFYLEMATTTEIDAFFDRLDDMGGVSREKNDQGEWIYREYPVGQAQVSGEIHTGSLTGSQIAAYNAKYPYLRVTADQTVSYIYYYNYDGTQLINFGGSLENPEQIVNGGNGTRTNNVSRTATAQYTYTPNGWATTPNGARDPNALINIEADRNVYAAYTQTVRTYTVYFYNGSTLLQTVQNVPYGGSATYTGSTPVSPDDASLPFIGWSPQPTNITGNTSCYAVFSDDIEIVEPDLKYLVYTIDETNNTMTITDLNIANILADNLTAITIPDTIQGYHVIIG